MSLTCVVHRYACALSAVAGAQRQGGKYDEAYRNLTAAVDIAKALNEAALVSGSGTAATNNDASGTSSTAKGSDTQGGVERESTSDTTAAPPPPAVVAIEGPYAKDIAMFQGHLSGLLVDMHEPHRAIRMLLTARATLTAVHGPRSLPCVARVILLAAAVALRCTLTCCVWLCVCAWLCVCVCVAVWLCVRGCVAVCVRGCVRGCVWLCPCSVAGVCYQLACAYIRTMDYDAAAEAAKLCHSVRKELVDPRSPYLQNATAVLASVYVVVVVAGCVALLWVISQRTTRGMSPGTNTSSTWRRPSD